MNCNFLQKTMKKTTQMKKSLLQALQLKLKLIYLLDWRRNLESQQAMKLIGHQHQTMKVKSYLIKKYGKQSLFYQVEKKLNSLVISSLLTTKFLRSEPIALCFPSSLEEWRKKKKHTEERKGRKPIRYSGKTDSTCDVDIPDISEKAKDSSWDSLNHQIKEDSDVFGKYPKVCNSSRLLNLNDHLALPGHQASFPLCEVS